MTSCEIHLVETLRNQLNVEQFNAIQNACKEYQCTLHENVGIDNSIQKIFNSPSHIILCDIATLVTLIKKYNYSPDQQLILMALHNIDRSLTPYADKVKNLRFVIGTTNAFLIEHLFSIILAHK